MMTVGACLPSTEQLLDVILHGIMIFAAVFELHGVPWLPQVPRHERARCFPFASLHLPAPLLWPLRALPLSDGVRPSWYLPCSFAKAPEGLSTPHMNHGYLYAWQCASLQVGNFQNLRMCMVTSSSMLVG